jgi:hypothetical protein
MKKVLLVVMSLLMITPTMQAKDKEEEYKVVVVKNEANGSYAYEQVVNVEGVSKEEMFSRAKKWIISNFKTNDNNIQFDETNLTIANTATVVLKVASGFNWALTSGLVNFKLNLQFKDGRYKFVFDNIAVQAAYSDGIVETVNYEQVQRNNKPAKHIRKEINEKLLAIATQMEEVIKTGGGKGKDDW